MVDVPEEEEEEEEEEAVEELQEPLGEAKAGMHMFMLR